MAERPTRQGRCRYGDFRWHYKDTPIGGSMRVYGEWAQNELEFLAQFVPPGGVVVDVGANIGSHSVAFGRFVGDRGRVYAVEPHPEIARLLEENVARNAGNVTVIAAAAGAAAAVARMPALPPEGWCNSGASGLTDRDGHEVRVDRLDSLVPEPADLVKIDAEGMEPSVLRGFRKGLAHRPVLMLEAGTAEHAEAILQQLEGHGYRCFVCGFRAFNGNNFRGCRTNHFGDAEESALLFVPAQRPAPQPLTSARLVPVADGTALAEALAGVPRFRRGAGA